MNRAQMIRKAETLRAQGMTHAAIAERLGVQRPAVTKMLNPDAKLWAQRDAARPQRKVAKRQWENEHDRKPCPQCGGPRGVGTHRSNPDGVCHDCHLNNDRARRLARRHQIERLWNLGRTLREIAAEMGSTSASIQVEMVHMRQEGGWDLPYRYAVENGRRVAA